MNPLAHILIGGKPTGFSGIMPGIIEEALKHLRRRKPRLPHRRVRRRRRHARSMTPQSPENSPTRTHP
ncbi:MAG: hypothetical protein ACKV19_00160 [Verrucomicrobiales bacterium]